MLLVKIEYDGWFNFFKNKELSKRIGFPLKPDDVIVISFSKLATIILWWADKGFHV